jgi:hypothetical protein
VDELEDSVDTELLVGINLLALTIHQLLWEIVRVDAAREELSGVVVDRLIVDNCNAGQLSDELENMSSFLTFRARAALTAGAWCKHRAIPGVIIPDARRSRAAASEHIHRPGKRVRRGGRVAVRVLVAIAEESGNVPLGVVD